jgi:hypothetical protein
MRKIPVEAMAAARNELCRRWEALRAKDIQTQDDAAAIIAEIQKIREGLDALAGKEEEITATMSRLVEDFWSVRQALGLPMPLPEDRRQHIEEQLVRLLTDSAEAAAWQSPPGDPPASASPGGGAAVPAEAGEGPRTVPLLRCPFCGGSRFERGKDIYAGKEPALYSRRTPRPGKKPNPAFCPRLRGSVCLTCGYVLTMVDLNELYAYLTMPAAEDDGESQTPVELPVAGILDDNQSVEEALRRLSSVTEEVPEAAPADGPPPNIQ